ncbi:MAG: small multi-drug export protein [Candidatus Nealsonbacteria bacterium]|nr:small multi-drug export protein [Candidatus Nealsonbacteria bacterium]
MLAELKVFLIAMSPIFELRGSIPIAFGVYGLPAWSSFIISIIGNLVPVVFILLLLEIVSGFLSRRIYFFNRFFAWLFEKTRKKHAAKFEKWKELALVILVAIPLPFTGAWTGSLCAFVFGIPFKKAFPLIAIGVIIAGIIVTFTTLGIINFI